MVSNFEVFTYRDLADSDIYRLPIILVSSSHNDRDQSLFISTDEGATFQKQPITFFVETLLFHPKEEDKVLAYTKEGKVYASIDLGKKWILLQERVSKDHIFWAVAGVDGDPDLVHMEIQDPSGGYRYITCQIQNCSDKTMTVQFAGGTDRDSLTVQDDYIFLQTTAANRTKYYVSYRRNGFVQMKLPKYALPKDLQIISTDENQVFVAVQEWYQTDTYNLYQSDPQGVYYSLLLENVRSTKQPEENVLIDILEVSFTFLVENVPEVRGVKGVFLANQKIDGKVTTLITYNKGRDWDFLNPPDIDMNGKPTNCKPGFDLSPCNRNGGLEQLAAFSSVSDRAVRFRARSAALRRVQGWRWQQLPGVLEAAPDKAHGQIAMSNVSFECLKSKKQYLPKYLSEDELLITLLTSVFFTAKPPFQRAWLATGNLGSQLVEYKEEMYITSDCGNTWRQVFEEEHHILYLDHGGVIVAIKDTSIPLKILKFAQAVYGNDARLMMHIRLMFSIDEGQTWSTHNFTSTSVFVDGLLSEPGDETLVMTVFGHISYRSDWELVKVDFRPSFPRECTDDDYESWDLTNLQGDRCIMGQQRSFRKRKISSWCIKGRSFTSALTSKVCECVSSDFLCDYGFERSAPLKSESSKCFADFWFNPEAPPEDCVLGQAYTSSTGYRKVVSNVCEGGVDLQQNLAQHMCPLTAPKGLQISIREESLAVKPGEDITFIVRQEQGDILNTKYQVDLGDGFKAIYVNLTMTGEPIRHRYENPGIYRVSVKAENVAGHDEAVVFIQVNSPLQALNLEVVPVIGRNQEVNLTAIILPKNPNLTVFYWWIGNNLQPLLTLDNFLVTKFAETGDIRVTVQASCGSSMLQDSKVVHVFGTNLMMLTKIQKQNNFHVLPLKFTKHLDMYNPDIAEWREDIGRVETNIPEETLMTVVKPGLPTTADLHVLLPANQPKRKRSVTSDKRIAAIKQALNAHDIRFFLRGGYWVLVTLADSDSVVFYVDQAFELCLLQLHWTQHKLLAREEQNTSRKLPGRNVYAQMHNEKEQEMTSPVNHSEDTQNIIQGEEFIDDDLDSQTLGNHSGVVLSINSREMHSYLVS
ncbi:Sorcs2 [Columba guinea]|nr:Sorcs2 [Columba guinea]